ncbi:dihydrolipoyllysine-residue acetyltransferase component of pyruvate dehydrogenase complex, mitochondrial-like [Varroa jacobsoni]|uniref:dihydrolipoyllysine-residue acetyltransferase component of pyruvate dehydrogenase complex, mitochondrial-like n=1 Tax=Varroa jacobsoni TaxID=62625 RepID=UPI000BF9B8DB|nr:dihydrolipoyllysine-residue acetyltransferase component of pyruvate dehydrogenase complex, mitochondrial-like [Varroa jacobsoni]
MMLRRPLAGAVISAVRLTVPKVTREFTSHLLRVNCAPGIQQTSSLRSHQRAQARCYSSGSYPSHIKVTLPALSPTMEMGTIVSWDKKEGDKLDEGDLLCEIETDKATMGFETPEEGYLAKIVIPAGSKDIPLGKLLCIIVSDPADIPAFKDFTDTSLPTAPPKPDSAHKAPTATPPAAAAGPSPVPAKITSSQIGAAPVLGDRIFASPFARLLAAQQGLDLASVVGSGPGGRVIAGDLSRAQSAGVSPVGAPEVAPQKVASFRYTDIDLTNMRQTIAKRLTESKQQIPHYSLTIEIEMDQVLKMREELNVALDQGKLSINDFIVKASALACKRVPAANSSFMGTFIREYHAVDVSVAVSTPDGLITPIVFNADTKGLSQISKDIKELATKAREKKLQPAEFLSGTFTVSNLGMFGVDHFSAIINPPQACILSVGKTSEVARPCKENGYRIVKAMKVTLNCDHRVVDGAVGAQWLQYFRNYLEKPHTMML